MVRWRLRREREREGEPSSESDTSDELVSSDEDRTLDLLEGFGLPPRPGVGEGEAVGRFARGGLGGTISEICEVATDAGRIIGLGEPLAKFVLLLRA